MLTPRWGRWRTIRVSDSAHRRMRAYCVANNLTMSSVLASLFRDIDPDAAFPTAPTPSPRGASC